MSAKEIELILSRQLADSLSIPVFIIDTVGDLIFYNEPAEELLGLRFEESGMLPVSEWSTIFKPQDADGNLIPPEELPLVKTLEMHIPAHGSFWVKSLSGGSYEISATSFPIMGRPHRFIGAIAIFWKNIKQ